MFIRLHHFWAMGNREYYVRKSLDKEKQLTWWWMGSKDRRNLVSLAGFLFSFNLLEIIPHFQDGTFPLS